MATLIRDRTLRTAPRFDDRLWRADGNTAGLGGGSADPREVGGYLEFFNQQNGQARHILANRRPWAGQGFLLTANRPSSTGTNRLRLWLSHSGTPAGTGLETATNGISLTISDTGSANVQQLVGSVSTTLSTANVTGKFLTGVDTRVRGERIGGRIRFRFWTATEAEPTTWDFDFADDGTVPAGVFAFSNLRSTTSVWRVRDIDVYASPGLYPVSPRPQLPQKLDGTRLPFGRQRVLRQDQVVDAALPAWLTGTVTTDLPAGTRRLAAAVGASAAVTGQPAQAEAHILTVHNLRLSSDTQVGLSIGFTDGTNTWEMKQLPTAGQVSLYVNGSATACPYQIRGNGEGPRHRTMTVMLVPAKQQLLAFEGDWRDGQLIGWVDLTSVPGRATSLTPVVTSLAGTAAAFLEFSGIDLEVHRS